MRKAYLLTICLLASLVAAAALRFSLSSFNAAYQGSEVRLEWRAESENDVQAFEISRKRPEESTYTRIAVINPAGTGSYSYVDDMLKSGQPSQLTYKLVVRGSSQSQTYFAALSGSPTAVQRSWGSIKSMFK